MDESQMKQDRRRRRPALSCVSCRKSKIRCDRNLPCGACVRSKHKTCVFEPQDPSLLRQSDISSSAAGLVHAAELQSSSNTRSPVENGSAYVHHGDLSHEDHSSMSLTGSTPVDSTSSQNTGPSFDVKSLLERIRELERRLEESTGHHPESSNAVRASASGSESITTYPSYIAGNLDAMSKGVMSKTRYLGQSHWMNQVENFSSVLGMFEQQCREKKSEPMALVSRCKAAGRTVKAQRWPELSSKFGVNIPPREIADNLIDAYFRTSESIFRIVHVPSFRKDYENFWLSPDSVDLSFLIQLQLVMAIGSTIYDGCFSMRKSATKWVYEAQCWLISPNPKSRLTLSGLQVMLLLCIAQEAAGVGPDLVWMPVGQLMRTAIFMGLHRDPKKLPKMTRLRSEMRRRLWNTILELALQTSIDSGGPPLIALQDFDTCAPANCDDDELTDDDVPTTASPPDKFTDMSMALALRTSFTARLAIAQTLNDISTQHSYDDIIRLHSHLSAVYKLLSQTLQRFTSTERQPTSFQRRLVDFIVRRYFMALHLPYFHPAMKEPTYAFSRKTVVEMSVKLYCTVFPSAALSPRPLRPSVNDIGSTTVGLDDLARFATCGSGFFRSIVSQAAMAIGFELQNQLQEDDGLGPPTPRVDLLNIFRDSISWLYLRIQAGETNVKGFFFESALLAQIEGFTNGLTGEELTDIIVKAGMDAVSEGCELLKLQIEPKPDENTTTKDAQFNFDPMMTMDGDWEYNDSMQNVLFDITSIDSVFGPVAGPDMMTADFSQW
ncbi:hypothetical protein F4818DRAFT_415085 [Hypoxylon cercidicola]|nr:hypothetical protein F4818DRAFT_415085 [Hypoxylon cercidicola]